MAANPLVPPLLRPSSTTPRARPQAATTAPPDPDALYHRLIRQAATSRDRARFLRAHQHELAQLAPAARQVVVRSAGMGLDQKTVEKALSPRSYANTQLRKAAEDVKGISGGLYHTAGAAAGDVKSTIHGKPTVKRTLKVVKETGKGIVETVEHPGRDLFQTATLVGGAVSGGAGIAGRVAAVGDVVKGTLAKDLPEAVGRLSKADAKAYATLANPDKHLPHLDEPTKRRIATPSPELGRVLDLDAHIAAVRSEVLKALGEGKLAVQNASRGATVREIGASKPARVAKAAVKTPLPRQRTLTVPGEDGKPAIVVHPVASKNALANALERHVIDRARQQKLNRRGMLPGSHGMTESLRLGPHEHEPAVQAAFHAINQVHASRPLPERVAVMAEKNLKGALGVRTSIKTAEGQLKPVAVEFDPRHEGIGATVTHEMGHVVHDMVAGHDHHVIAAAALTKGTKELAKYPGALKVYGMRPQELFARAYSQYVAEKSGHPAIAEGLRKFDERLAERGVPAFHWSHEDFKPVAKAFDEMFQKLGWRVNGKPAEAPRDLPAVGRHVSPEASVGRELRAQRHVQDALELAGVSRLERFGTSKPARILKGISAGHEDRPALMQKARANRLTAAEQKAIDIVSSGAAPATHVAYHRNRLQELANEREALSQENILRKVAGTRAIRVEQRRHEAHAGLSELAGKALAEPRPPLTKAIEETRGVIGQREKALGIGKPEAAHRVGARAAEIEAGARGFKSPLIQLDELEKLHRRLTRRIDALGVKVGRGPTAVPNGVDMSAVAELVQKATEVESRIGQIHEQMTARGAQAIEEGAFYLPSQSLVKMRRTPAFARRPGPLGLGPPKKLPELSHSYTGALQRTGNFRTDATGLAAESYRRAQSYATLLRAHSELLRAAHSTREAAGPYAIPIRTTYTIPQRLRTALLRADQGTLTPEEMRAVSTTDLASVVKELFPEARELDAAEMANVRWIDSRLLGGARTEHDYGGKLGRAADLVNVPFRAALLYTKPAYALNLLQALGTNLIQQGVFTPVNITRALRLGRDLGSEDQLALFALVGQGLSRSLEADMGLGRVAIHVAGEFWNAVIDRYPRVASILHEMRREGFNTPEKIHALLNDPRMEAKRTEITRRANKEAIEYGELTPFERNVVKRALFFYPWIRGATLYTLRFPKEHPIQAAVYAQLGGQGHERSVRAFGPFVDYGPGTAGLVPVGKNRGSNLSNLNTFATPVDIGEALANPTKIPQQLGPLPGAIYTAISHKTPLGVELPATKNPYVAAGQQLSDLIPFVQALNRAKAGPDADKVVKQPVFPKGPQAAVERYIGGSAFPQPVNKPALAAKGEKAYTAGLGPEAKAKYNAAKTLQQAEKDAAALHKAGVLRAPGLPATVRQALDLDRRRKLAYARLGSNASAADKAKATAQVVRQAKTAPPAIVANYERLIAQAPDANEASKITARFWRVYGRGAALSSWRYYVTTSKRR